MAELSREPADDGAADTRWMLQLYRSFVHTATMWRQRMDVTANWAVPMLIGLATFALGDARLPHPLFLLLGAGLIGSAVIIEARRYRALHHATWRASLIEIGWFAPLLAGVEVDPRWRVVLATDLCQPRPSLRMATAVLARMRASYLVHLHFLVLAWICKVAIHPRVAGSTTEVLERMRLGPLPGAWFAAAVAVLIAAATLLTLCSPSQAELANTVSEDPALRATRGNAVAVAIQEDRPARRAGVGREGAP